MTRLIRLSKAEALADGVDFYFSPEAAAHAVDFIENHLTHSKGRWAGEKFKLLPWQKVEVIEELFGWLRVDNGKRRYRVGYITTPKKCGKSTLLAGIGLYLLVADNEPGAEVYGVGVDTAQASIVFREAASMIRASATLSPRLQVVDSRRTVAYVARSAFYKVIAGEGSAFRAEGLNIHGLLFDELHAQRTRDLWDALRFGGAAREQPLLIAITTAGYDRSSICYEQHAYATRVLADWRVDPTFFAYIAGAAEDDDWTDPAVWAKANPSWGITIDPESFAAEFREAEQSNAKQNAFRRYRLNQWTKQQTRFINMTIWDACRARPPVPLAGRPCWVGLDLASTQDTSAMVAVFPDADGSIDVYARFWIPSDNMVERERRDRVQYSRWVGGDLTATSGNVTDYDVIRRDIVEFAKHHNVRKLVADKWMAIQLSNQLDGDGINVEFWPQSFAGMNAPTRQLETMLAAGKVRHNSELLTIHAGNCSVKTNPEGYIRPVKAKPGSPERVDGIVSLIMAIGAWSGEVPQAPAPKPSIIML
jgi:phage terminase large subunit-like protein